MNTTLRVGLALVLSAVIVWGGIHYNKTSDVRDEEKNREEQAALIAAQIAQEKQIMDKLKIEDVKVGTGTEATVGTLVTVHYTGKLADGTVFDSSRTSNQPFPFILGTGGVIQGWDLGVAGMKVGGVRNLTIPPELAYGPQGYGPIPGNATLHFEVELLKVEAGGNH